MVAGRCQNALQGAVERFSVNQKDLDIEISVVP